MKTKTSGIPCEYTPLYVQVRRRPGAGTNLYVSEASTSTTVTSVTNTTVPSDSHRVSTESRRKKRMKERRMRERKIYRKKERESHTRRQISPPCASLAHTISDHYTCTRIRSRSARRYARVKKREVLQLGRETEKSREREVEWRE